MSTPTVLSRSSSPKSLRIAFVVNHVNMRGGMERHAAEHLKRLSRHHHIHVFTSELEDVPEAQLAGITLIPLPRKPFLRYLFDFRRLASKAVKQAGTFDIVHATGGIITDQNFVAMHYCHSAWNAVLREQIQARRGVNAYHRLNLLIATYYERRACADPRTLGLTACSVRTADDISRFYGTERSKINVVHNGADPERFHPDALAFRHAIRERYRVPQNALLFLYVGEYQRKGLLTVLEALSRIESSDSAAPVYLLAVGRGSIPAYEAQARHYAIADRVIFAEPTSHIEQVFGASDAFVFPTLYEPFGMVILEAMFTGLPVITSRAAGAAELIRHGENGFLVDDATNVDALATQMRAVLAMSSSERRALGNATRASVLSQTWDHAVAKTEAAYFDALERGK